jgi:hypothetical protein
VEGTSGMGIYMNNYIRDMRNSDAFEKVRKKQDTGEPSPEGEYRFAKKPEGVDYVLSDDQLDELRGKYNLKNMTFEEEERFMQDLNEMGILSKEDCGSFTKVAGNIFDVLTRQVSADINLLYQMAIAGRYSSLHIEHIRSQQKLLDILEQLMAE